MADRRSLTPSWTTELLEAALCLFIGHSVATYGLTHPSLLTLPFIGGSFVVIAFARLYFRSGAAIVLLALSQIEWFESNGAHAIALGAAAFISLSALECRRFSYAAPFAIILGALVRGFLPDLITIPFPTAIAASLTFVVLMVLNAPERSSLFASNTPNLLGLLLSLYLLSVSVHTAHYQTLSGEGHNQHERIVALFGSSVCWSLIAFRELMLRGRFAWAACCSLMGVVIVFGWIIGIPPALTTTDFFIVLFSPLLALIALTFWPMDLSRGRPPGTLPWLGVLAVFFVFGSVVALALHGGPRELKTPLLTSVSRSLVASVLSVEDIIFFQHAGIDMARMHSEVRQLIRGGELHRGGSTITMQLAKMQYLDYAPTFYRKGVQCGLALWLEATHTKESILREYLTRLDFGRGYLGVDAAAQGYFGVPESALTSHQRSAIVYAIRDPYSLNPKTLATASEKRRILDGITARSKVLQSSFSSSLSGFSWVKR